MYDNMMIAIQWITLVISVIASIGINYKKRFSFYLYIVSNALMIVLFVSQKNVAQVFQFGFFIGLNIHGLVKWKKDVDAHG